MAVSNKLAEIFLNIMRKIKIEIIVVAILWINVIYSIVTNHYVANDFWLGIIGLIIATLCLQKFQKFASYFLMLLLLLSIAQLIAFSSTIYLIGMFGVGVNILSLILFSILVYKRKNMINEFLEKDSEEIQENTKINLFKKEFQKLSDSELENKINNDQLVKDAKDAIIELLNERKQ
jgi:hypothetical protein